MLKVLISKAPSNKQLWNNCILYNRFIRGGLSSKLNKKFLYILLNIFCTFHKIVLIECFTKDSNGENHLIGSSLCAQSLFDRSIYNIALLSVDCNYRRRGIGSIMLSTGENFLEKNLMHALTIKVKTINAIDNKAIDFYIENGFKIDSRKEKYLVLSKKIR